MHQICLTYYVPPYFSHFFLLKESENTQIFNVSNNTWTKFLLSISKVYLLLQDCILFILRISASQAIQSLIASGDYGYAIDLIEYSTKLLDGDLKGIVSLQDHKSGLQQMKSHVQGLVVDDFVSTCVSNLEQIDKVIFSKIFCIFFG